MRFKVFSCFQNSDMTLFTASKETAAFTMSSAASTPPWSCSWTLTKEGGGHWRSRKCFSVLVLDNTTILNGLKSLDNTESLLRRSRHTTYTWISKVHLNLRKTIIGINLVLSAIVHQCDIFTLYTSGHPVAHQDLQARAAITAKEIKVSNFFKRSVYFSSYMKQKHALLPWFYSESDRYIY